MVKFTIAIARIRTAMMAKVSIERRSLPGVIGPPCAFPRCTSRRLTKCQSCSSPWLKLTLPLG